MSQDITIGKIIDWKEDGSVLIRAVLPNFDRALKRKYNSVQVGFEDDRHISPEQRRKIYALIGEIADYVGEHPETTKASMKMDFILNRMQSMTRKMFSLANCSVELASDFITYLVEFIINNDIPTQVSLVDNCEDISKYVYACLMNKKCAVCGRPADLHHVDVLGMGMDRTEAIHIGRAALPLCRNHHTEIHSGSPAEFLQKHHLETVKIDKQITKVYKLKVGE